MRRKTAVVKVLSTLFCYFYYYQSREFVGCVKEHNCCCQFKRSGKQLVVELNKLWRMLQICGNEVVDKSLIVYWFVVEMCSFCKIFGIGNLLFSKICKWFWSVKIKNNVCIVEVKVLRSVRESPSLLERGDDSRIIFKLIFEWLKQWRQKC